jgi:hypothetical protein
MKAPRARPFRSLGLPLLLVASLAAAQDTCILNVINYSPQNLTVWTFDGYDTKCANPYESYVVAPPVQPGNLAGTCANALERHAAVVPARPPHSQQHLA